MRGIEVIINNRMIFFCVYRESVIKDFKILPISGDEEEGPLINLDEISVISQVLSQNDGQY